MNIREIWDDPANGITEAAFKHWPDKHGLQREKNADYLQAAFDQSALIFPVYAVGSATLYKSPDGEPRIGANMLTAMFFAVCGMPGTMPGITFMQAKGLFNKRVNVLRPGASGNQLYDDYQVEDRPVANVGAIELQFVEHNLPVFRIAFDYWTDV